MKTNKLDNNIKNKLENRTIEPSASAWERLSNQLDEQPVEKKKGWFFYIGIAASILLLVSIGIQFISDKEDVLSPKEIIVDTPIDTNTIDNKIDKVFNEVPIEKAIGNNTKIEEKVIVKEEINKNVIANKVNQSVKNKKINSFKTSNKDKIVIAKVDKKELNNIENSNDISTEIEKSKKINILKQDPNSSIKINSDDLLFAVTHSPQEVKEYYAKYNVSRDDVLKTIRNQLKESNIKINPDTILAEVERTIGEEDFQNNFLKSLKRRVSNIATAIASRND